MSTHSTGEQARIIHLRNDDLDLDLNITPPPGANLEQMEEITQVDHQAVPQTHQVTQPIDLEAFDDDDVILSTQSDFLEAKNNSRRHRGSTIADVDILANNVNHAADITPDNPRRDDVVNPTTPNCDPQLKLEDNGSSHKEQKPEKEPIFTCPICMDPFEEEVSTKCGHIFCRSCIKAAIKAQGKCPTCRVKVTQKGLIRVFLPSAS
ncbi:E3 ubiquitin-protein ligase RNF4-like [Neltuma alba]|uniref:E3 ubiquitin-protein ligase RNF4-like n=1 Tax=Neltuma alba TaxID=207710 RepID=UPI0010A4E0AE|nr:E3 ubiquitin-protein ligase RNF4-like [Prosopis alba]